MTRKFKHSRIASKSAPAASSDVVVLQFAEAPKPVFKEVRDGSYVRFGADNLYPNYLLSLYAEGTKHAAILGGKVTYITGGGWQIKDGATDDKAQQFIGRPNRYEETLWDISRKAANDIEIFGGCYFQTIWNNAGTGLAEVYHIDYSRIRSNADNTQFTYKEDWSNSRDKGKIYPAFNPSNRRGSQIFYYKEYRPGLKTYALPGYIHALNYINAEIEVSKHVLGNSKNGFKPSKMITMVGGDPAEEEKKKLDRRFRKATTGPDGYSFMLMFVPKSEWKPIVEDLGASDMTKEDFSKVDNMIQGNIYAAHRITTPALFGIATPGQLGQHTELETGYEIFKNTYVNDKQLALEQVFNKLAGYFGATVPLSIKRIAPIDFVVPAAAIVANLTPEEIRQKAGLAPVVSAEKTPAQVLNESITKLSPIVATKVLNSLTLNEIRQLASLPATPGGDVVPVQPATQANPAPVAAAYQFRASTRSYTHDDEELALQLFAEYGRPKSDFIAYKTRKYRFSDDEIDDFSEHQLLSFAAEQINKIQASILDLISKDKRITPEVLADTLKVKLDEITAALAGLEEVGAVKVGKDENDNPTRELTKPLEDLQEGTRATTRAFAVRYSYDGPQDEKNRPFCAKMMELGRYYSRADIEAISARLGYSVWDRRGGFYTNPDTGETTPWCRHTWFSHVVLIK